MDTQATIEALNTAIDETTTQIVQVGDSLARYNKLRDGLTTARDQLKGILITQLQELENVKAQLDIANTSITNLQFNEPVSKVML